MDSDYRDVKRAGWTWEPLKRGCDTWYMETDFEINLLIETGGGGSGQHVLDLYRGLKERAIDARLFVSLRRADVLFRTALLDVDQGDLHEMDVSRSPAISDIIAISRLRRFLVRQRKVQIVHAHSTKAGVIAAALARRGSLTVFTPHAYRGMDNNLGGVSRMCIRWADAILSSGHSRIIAVSQSEFDYALSIGVAREKLRLISNGVNVPKLQVAADEYRYRRVGGRNDICFVGRLVSQKNPLIFLKTIETLLAAGLRVHGHIVGDGYLRSELGRYVSERGLVEHITFYGTTEAIPIMAKCDLLIHTSIYESAPYCLLEAIALGIPIVGVENGGTRMILGPRLTLCTDPYDYRTLAERAAAVLVNGDVRGEILRIYNGIRGDISIDTMIAGIIEEYEGVCAAASGRAVGGGYTHKVEAAGHTNRNLAERGGMQVDTGSPESEHYSMADSIAPPKGNGCGT